MLLFSISISEDVLDSLTVADTCWNCTEGLIKALNAEGAGGGAGAGVGAGAGERC